MRLTAQQQATVRATVLETFGADAQVRLFGSRADDNKRGGDIDLLITASKTDVQTILFAELALLAKLEIELGEQPDSNTAIAGYMARIRTQCLWVQP